jgi:hypothetical protein
VAARQAARRLAVTLPWFAALFLALVVASVVMVLALR